MSNSIRTLLIALTLLTAGCGTTPPPTVVVMPPATATPPPVAPTAPAPVPGTIPPPIGTPGMTTPPPIAVLPVPVELTAEAERIRARFGLQSVKGSGTTKSHLEALETALARYPLSVLANLHVVNEPAERTPHPEAKDQCAGMWWPVDAQGRDQDTAVTVAYPAGRIYMIGTTGDMATLVHEVGHHLTLMSDEPFGKRLMQALGYTLKSAGGATGTGATMYFSDWAADRVDARSYPDNYSKTSWMEHLAELMCAHRVSAAEWAVSSGDDPRFARPATFAISSTVSQTLDSAFGPAYERALPIAP